ncbi:MAG: hypothetical protein Q7S53_05025 [bacterium]|nr:hypothetical protein [bacterium]
MTIKVNTLKPKLTFDDVDIYLPRGIKALAAENQNPIGFWRLFQRYEGARFFGVKEFLSALASLVHPDDVDSITIYSVPEGHALKKHETAMTMEGPARSLLVNETLLHYLTTGTRFRTLAADFPHDEDELPWVFMGARYLAQEDLAIATRALSEGEIISTVPRWADKVIGTESHSQIAMWGALRLDDRTERVIAEVTDNPGVAATIRATIAFHRANPNVPLFVLGDFVTRSVGCFETFRATKKACEMLGIKLAGGRMDISKADLDDEPVVDAVIGGNSGSDAGMKLHVVQKTREMLDQAGMADFKLVVSSGIKLEDIKKYREAGADIVGIGEQAAYYLNQGQCNYTADAVGFFNGGKLNAFAKEGRELSRVVDPEVLDNATRGVKISDNLIRHNLRDYL